MGRRTGLLGAIAQAQRDAERQRQARVRAQAAETKAREKAQREYEQAQQALERERERQLKEARRAAETSLRITEQNLAALEKEQQRLYVEARTAEVELKNSELLEAVAELEGILAATLGVDDALDLDTRKLQPKIAPFDPGALGVAGTAPVWTNYEPAPLSGMQKLVPGAKGRHEQQVVQARARFEADNSAYLAAEAERLTKLAELQREYDQVVAGIQARAAAQHAEIETLKASYRAGETDAVTAYFRFVLETRLYPAGFPQRVKLAYVPESKQLVVEYDLPPFEVIPTVASHKYVKSRDEISATARTATWRRSLYASVIAQNTLRTLHELFEADRPGHIETIVFNGYVESIDRGTGRDVRTCIVTVRTTRDVFMQIDLTRVDPAACLKTLNASVSKSPAELTPVRPVLEFSMVDKRFIDEVDVLSGLDQRVNLMELSPSEFEHLISNLFSKMGLDTRVTQASNDGGVDCVAFDPRPIFGGKVVIQAKRYKHTVGVSAVRDLFGTVQNEGASKGILVTTSGFGQASTAFASGKPLELIDGASLLYLLAEYASVQAKIMIPED